MSENYFGDEIFEGPLDGAANDVYYEHNESKDANNEETEGAHELLMKKIMAHVEHFLLPSQDERYWAVREKDFDTINYPRNRLENILFDLTLADHIRLMQSLYRDNEDDQKLESELRIGNDTIKLPTKVLMERITEGRARVLALSRLCFTDDSIEVLRAVVDLANSYASQGMWPQVSDHMSIASQRLLTVHTRRISPEFELSRNQSLHAAARVGCVFRVLREHAMGSFGEVKYTVVKEVAKALEKLDQGAQDRRVEGQLMSAESLGETIQLTTLLHDYFQNHSAEGSMRADQSPPSWGDFVDYLRRDCPVMTAWISDMNNFVLPQNKSCLRVAFYLSDIQKRGVVHPAQFAQYFGRLPSLAKVVAGSGIVQSLMKMKVEVPLHISSSSPENGGAVRIVGNTEGQRVDYELPITWEELFAMVIVDCEQDQLGLLRMQIQTMTGVCAVFANKLPYAESNMREALKSLEQLGLDMEVPACELYNSIAQMMIMKHRQWHAKKKSRLKQEIQQKVQTEEGQAKLALEAKAVRQKAKEQGLVLTKEQSFAKARSDLIREGIKTALDEVSDPTTPSLVASYRYLIMSHEIVERVHGAVHPCVGAACLAIASVQNVSGDLIEARDWLVKALRVMERLHPPPYRAIAFVQVQLSQILAKEGHEKEAIEVLRAAASFHLMKSKEAINAENFANKARILQPLPYGHIGFEDVKLALSLMEKLLIMMTNNNFSEEAIGCADEMADLAENAFGWYSQEAALCRKEVGLRHVRVEDWRGACLNFKKSFEAHEMCFGEKDPRTIDIQNLLTSATAYRNAGKSEKDPQTFESDAISVPIET
eukprot:gene7315-14913_t